MEEYKEIERSIIKKYRKEIWSRFVKAVSEYELIKENDKKPIIMGLFRKLMYIALLPLTMIFIISGVNAILTSFSRAMKGSVDMTIAAQMLSVATYDSNKYRVYAQQNKRVPIVIQAYNPDDYDPDENDLLVKRIESLDVQTNLELQLQIL